MGFFSKLFGKGNNTNKSKETYTPQEPLYLVTITNETITSKRPDGQTQSINWNEIEEIKITTTSDGPVLPDVWLTLIGNGKTCMLPQDYPGYEEVYEVVSKYPNFDFRQVINAMTSTGDEQFDLWMKNSDANNEGNRPPSA